LWPCLVAYHCLEVKVFMLPSLKVFFVAKWISGSSTGVETFRNRQVSSSGMAEGLGSNAVTPPVELVQLPWMLPAGKPSIAAFTCHAA